MIVIQFQTCRSDANNLDSHHDCFYELNDCNEDMQCIEFFSNYTEECSMALSGDLTKS